MAVTLSDNFNDNSLDTGKWGPYNNNGSVTETNNRLQIAITPSTIGAYAGVYSVDSYNLQGSFVEVNIQQGATPGCDTLIGIRNSTAPYGTDLLWISNPSDGGVHAVIRDAYDWVTSTFVSVSLGSNFYVRIRESGGTVYWDYSTDGRSSWTNAKSSAVSALPITSVTDVEITLDVYEFSSSGGTTNSYSIFENFNVPLQISVFDTVTVTENLTGPASSGTLLVSVSDTVTCSESVSLLPTVLPLSLSDDFNDNSLDAVKWATAANTATVSESNSRIEFDVPATTSDVFAEVYSQSNYSFVDRSIFISILQGAEPYVDNYFLIREAGGSDQLGFIYSGGTLYAYTSLSSVGDYPQSVAATPGTSFWVRLKSNAGTVYWEYSTNNQQSWTSLYSAPVSSLFSVSSVSILFGTYKWSASTTTTTKAIFDNFNTIGALDVSDTVSVTESLSFSGQLFISVDDQVSVGESLGRSGDIFRSVSDTVTVGESSPVYIFQTVTPISVYDAVTIFDFGAPSIESTLLIDLGQTLNTVYVSG